MTNVDLILWIISDTSYTHLQNENYRIFRYTIEHRDKVQINAYNIGVL